MAGKLANTILLAKTYISLFRVVREVQGTEPSLGESDGRARESHSFSNY